MKCIRSLMCSVYVRRSAVCNLNRCNKCLGIMIARLDLIITWSFSSWGSYDDSFYISYHHSDHTPITSDLNYPLSVCFNAIRGDVETTSFESFVTWHLILRRDFLSWQTTSHYEIELVANNLVLELMKNICQLCFSTKILRNRKR